MSGHSKWHRIKRQKAITDAKRGQEFTRLASQIKIAARAGTDPDLNPALADAIARAKAANMPQTNIDRLLHGSDRPAENIIYEAFGPAGISLLITAATDNPKRTISDIRTILKKYGGRLGQPGSVAWKFTHRFSITLNPPSTGLTEGLELALIEAGADNLELKSGQLVITADPSNQTGLLSTIAQHRLIVNHLDQSYTAKQAAFPTPPELTKLVEELLDNPDIEHVYTDAVE